jgi:hypothetical protein
MNTKNIISITTGLAIAASMALAIPAFAETNAPGSQSNGGPQSNGGWSGQGYSQLSPGHTAGQDGLNRGQGMMKPGVSGTVTAVNGNIITINGRQSFGSTTPTVSYTVNATNATVRKGNATSTVSSIAIGDVIAVQGTVTGTNVAATTIFDGVTGRMGLNGSLGNNGQNDQGRATSTPIIGNGQPIVAGTVSVVSGNTLTVTTASNVTYTVTIDASSTKILQGQNTIALSSIVVGNKVLVQGTVNGTSVTASTVIDQSGVPVAGEKPAQNKGQPKGFFAGIGQFFMHMFGF